MRYPVFLILFTVSVAGAQIDYSEEFSTGRITWYEQDGSGACEIPESEWPEYTTAISEKHFQEGLACGATARLRNGDKEIEVMIVDLCPVEGNERWCSGDLPHFDLGNSPAFSQLEELEKGVTELQFKWVPTPVGDKPVKLRLKDGVNAWWVALQVLNHRYPIAKLEVKDPETGEWITGNKQYHMWNYWQFSFTGSGLTTPYEIRITDQFGQVIEETGNSLEENFMWEGTHQFPVRADASVSDKAHGSHDVHMAAPGDAFRISGGRLFSGEEMDARIIITDISGRSVAQLVVDRQTGIARLPHLSPGLYYVKMLSGRSAPRTLRWVSTE